jgi:hypothetical protein
MAIIGRGDSLIDKTNKHLIIIDKIDITGWTGNMANWTGKWDWAPHSGPPPPRPPLRFGRPVGAGSDQPKHYI